MSYKIIDKLKSGEIYIKFFPKEHYSEQLSVILEEVFDNNPEMFIGQQEGWLFAKKDSLIGVGFTNNPKDVEGKEVLHVSLVYHLLLNELNDISNDKEMGNKKINDFDTIYYTPLEEKIKITHRILNKMAGRYLPLKEDIRIKVDMFNGEESVMGFYTDENKTYQVVFNDEGIIKTIF